MKILYISQYFYPEVCAPSNRAMANVKYLADKGHEVNVLTEMPNHPRGVIFEGYKHKLFLKESIDNFLINRVWVFTSKKKNFITRMLFYVSFMIFGTIHTLINWKKYDIVYTSSPPLFVAGIATILKKFFPKIKSVFEVRDLWPDSAIDLGELNNRFAIKLSMRLEKKIYSISERIIVISKYIKNKIIDKGIAEDKITIIHNGTDEEFITKTKKVPQNLLEKYKTKKNFIVVYAGNIGIAQNLNIVINSAEMLQNENILFLFVGDGPNKNKLEQLVIRKKIANVIFVGEIDREKIHEYLCLADCGVVILKRIPLFTGALPSKIFDYMACDLPILLGVEGEAKTLIEDSGTGLGFESDNSEDLAKQIIYLKNHPEELHSITSKGNNYVYNSFNRTKQASKIEDILKKLLENK